MAFKKEKEPFTIFNIQQSITSFIKSIFSFNSPYDNFNFKNKHDALTESQQNGMKLFFSDSLNCSKCHGGINFNTPEIKDIKRNRIDYFNTGLYNLDSLGGYPAYDEGLYEHTKNKNDKGKYLVPTLRNLAFTGPYFHDGSARTLDDVLRVYEEGGRNLDSGMYRGDGRRNVNKSPLINGFRISSQQHRDMVNFLLSLSDSTIIINPNYANPFIDDETKR